MTYNVVGGTLNLTLSIFIYASYVALRLKAATKAITK